MTEQEKTLLLEMARRLANLEKALKDLCMAQRRVTIMELGILEDHLSMKRSLEPHDRPPIRVSS